jgi:hypothetical protein
MICVVIVKLHSRNISEQTWLVGWFMVFNATFNNSSVISWRSVLLVEGNRFSYTSPYWRSGISSTSVRNSVFSRVERSGTSGKTLNFSHEWKKSQIFKKDECKYLFLPFQLKNKACRFHPFIRMSMSCLLHKILQRHVQCSKYTII